MREHTDTHISNPATSIWGFPPFSGLLAGAIWKPQGGLARLMENEIVNLCIL
jgi:hypothetical protein